MNFYLETILNVFMILIISMFFYWFIISLFGFGKHKTLLERTPQKKFAIIIPSHNEENVIVPLIKNLKSLDYPKELYDIYVIADNCTDRTAHLAKETGAKVIEHTSKVGELKGKPYAIQYALEILGEDLEKKYDAISVFDADNLVSKNYLIEMNKHLLEGHKLIQCYLDTKNPNDNWVTLGYATSYYYMNRSWQLAKSRLGLGNAVGGTGFTVEVQLLNKIGWSARSLTEDLEFTMQCLLEGEKAYWSHEARILDEKPVSFKSSCIQRLRWARGHWDVCFKYSPKLLKRWILKRDFAAFDGFMYLINPAKMVTGSFLDLFLIIMTVNLLFSDTKESITFLLPFHVVLTFFAFSLIYIVYSIRKDVKYVKVNYVKAILSMILTNISYLPLFVWALFTYKRKEWNPTQHTRNIQIEDISDFEEFEMGKK